MSAPIDVLVVGGGVMGCATALFLQRAGMRTLVVDKDALCREASGVNAGTLTLLMTRAVLIPHALRGHRMWTTARGWLGDDLGVTATRGLCLAFDEAEAELLERRSATRREAGAPIELVGPARARSIEPGLGDIRIAAHCAIDGHVPAYRTARAFRRALVDAGVELREYTRIEHIEVEERGFVAIARGEALRAPRLVLAGGAWLGQMLAWLGLEIHLACLANQLAVTERLRPVMRTVLTVASGLLSLKQFADGTVVIGGGWQGTGGPERAHMRLRTDSLIGNLRLACLAVPELRGARMVRAWTGPEAETRDALPLLGPVPGVPEAYVIGSVHSGYTSGPFMGRLLAERILGREPELPLFPPERLLAEPQPARGDGDRATRNEKVTS